MKTALLIFMTATLSATAQPTAAKIMVARLAALSQIETGDRDNPPGTQDLSRFGISRPVWAAYTGLPASQATNRQIAAQVASRILRDRIDGYTATYGHEPTEAQIYILWHKPATVTHPSAKTAEIAARFANLVNDP